MKTKEKVEEYLKTLTESENKAFLIGKCIGAKEERYLIYKTNEVTLKPLF